MPYIAEKAIVAGTKYDKRVKLTSDQKAKIRSLYPSSGYSYAQIAAMFGVSKRTVYFIVNPEKQVENFLRRLERGGSKQYYSKEKHRETMKTHRKYAHKLFTQGKIKLKEEK